MPQSLLPSPIPTGEGRSTNSSKGGGAASFFVLLCLLLSRPLAAAAKTRLYWFVPDGLRADPKVCDVFGWAQQGKLPNIKKMMDNGAWGYSIPVFPSHTPVNFATLMTGAYPEVHGISDGPMRIQGRHLSMPSVNGFSSTAKKVPPIWKTLEDAGLKVAVVSVPGSTPPELDAGWTVRGRWGGWGVDLHAINFESQPDPGTAAGSSSDRLFSDGPELTRVVPLTPATGWSPALPANPKASEMAMLAYGATIYAYVSADSSKGTPLLAERERAEARAKAATPSVLLSLNKNKALGRLTHSNDWTPWLPITLFWQGTELRTQVRIGLIRAENDFIKLRLLFDVLNPTIVQPPKLSDSLHAAVGPMVDFPDNWPAQLNRLPEERDILLTETRWALEWHAAAARHLLTVERPDVVIQDTYVPNQFLESRWWLKHVDPDAPAYVKTPEDERKVRAHELLEIYQGIDAVLGEALKAAPDAIIVLSSDHGILPIRKEVLVNNLLAREGLLTFHVDPNNGEPTIDWSKTKAAYLKMIGVYVHPDGLAGDWKRGSGLAYEALRARVKKLLEGLKDDGHPVFRRVVPWENAAALHLPKDRVPDLILSMTPGYALTEDMARSRIPFPAQSAGEGQSDGTHSSSATLPVLREPLQSGYKQAIEADDAQSLWTPFVAMGPGIKKGFRLERPIHNPDQAPTLLHLLGIQRPPHIKGQHIRELSKG